MRTKLMMRGLFLGVAATAVNAFAGGYDVAAFVWPAYHPEPRWRELGIFADGKGEWQSLYETYARKIRDWADANIPKNMPRLITVNSWNEWTEGGYLEPDSIFGYGYLDALRKVFVEEVK